MPLNRYRPGAEPVSPEAEKCAFSRLTLAGVLALSTPIVAHALYDFVALVYLTRGPGSDLPTEPEPDEEGEAEE